jgi:hypothetical protein
MGLLVTARVLYEDQKAKLAKIEVLNSRKYTVDDLKGYAWCWYELLEEL